jgi:Tfp pilus assembly protein PilF
MGIVRVAAALTLLLLGACSTQPVQTFIQGKGAPALSSGVAQFEQGRYAEATKSINTALQQGLSSNADQARAHKYLAFIHCVSNRMQQCRDEFGRALDANPSMALEPSESGHPIWGPVFKTVRSRR